MKALTSISLSLLKNNVRIGWLVYVKVIGAPLNEGFLLSISAIILVFSKLTEAQLLQWDRATR